jgi:hypothetical protein
MALSKGSKMYAIVNHKCPRCHEGDLYPTKMWSFKKPFTMRLSCIECGQAFFLEPGFYWGSMYVAYALSSVWMLLGIGVGVFLFDLRIMHAFIPTMILLFLMYVPIFRISRSIWINIFVHYKRHLN